MSEWQELIFWLLSTAVLQNVIMTTGFGTSLVLRVLNTKSDIWKFGAILSLFLIVTMLVDYPVDLWLGLGARAKLFRPLVMVAIAAAVYFVFTVIVARVSVPFYKKIKVYVGPAAFNNLTIGLTMIANHKVSPSFWGTLGLAIGSALGFMLIGWLLLEGRARLDTYAVPVAFRGVPISLLYLGIIALALLGFGNGLLV